MGRSSNTKTTQNTKKANTDLQTDGPLTHAYNKAGYTATLIVCGWAGAVLEKITRASGQELYAQKAK